MLSIIFVDFVNTAYSELLVSDKFHKLQECGIYDMTADMYARKCLSFSGAQYALDTVESQYDAITEQQHAEKEYREARKASRGRWRGGGFGLGGALKRCCNSWCTQRSIWLWARSRQFRRKPVLCIRCI